MMKRSIITLLFIAVIFIAIAIMPNYFFADEIETSVNVLGTQVDTYSIDVKSVDVTPVSEDENSLTVEVGLVNTVDQEVSLDAVNFTVKTLGGETVISKSYEYLKKVKAKDDPTLEIFLPNELKSGRYIGSFELYSENILVGKAETIVSILPSDNNVLGVGTADVDSINTRFFSVSGIITLVFVTLSFMLRNVSGGKAILLLKYLTMAISLVGSVVFFFFGGYLFMGCFLK